MSVSHAVSAHRNGLCSLQAEGREIKGPAELLLPSPAPAPGTLGALRPWLQACLFPQHFSQKNWDCYWMKAVSSSAVTTAHQPRTFCGALLPKKPPP